MNHDQALQNCKFAPYWWDDVPRPRSEDFGAVPLPAEVDVAVVGSGYTGLHAALQTARGGRRTLVPDAEDAGWGCSTRNGGQVSTSIKPSLAQLAARHGQARAVEILKEGQRSLKWIAEFVRSEAIDCDFAQVGRFHAAHNAAQFDGLRQRVEQQPKGLEVKAHVVPRERQREELGSDAYFGGVVYEEHCSVHPARYHRGLLDRVIAAGAQIAPRTPVTAIARTKATGPSSGTERHAFELQIAGGTVRARNVVIATNGYTGELTPWLRRRVIPIGSYIIATDELPAGWMDRLIPKNRIVSDTRKVVYYYRASPDRKRILFGGRVSHSETDPRLSGPLLRRDMNAIFPELAEIGLSHSWCGLVAYSFDELMHVGVHDGMHYAMGYCGAGVGTASYFGMRVGQQVLGLAEGRTALDDLPFETRPLYTGNPWFLAPSVAYYRLRDRLPI